MSWQTFAKQTEHQNRLIDNHLAKAAQCLEYRKTDDALVHLTIAEILQSGIKAKFYKQESLSNLAQSLTK